jgi:hypothetical protein
MAAVTFAIIVASEAAVIAADQATSTILICAAIAQNALSLSADISRTTTRVFGTGGAGVIQADLTIGTIAIFAAIASDTSGFFADLAAGTLGIG